MAQPGRRIATNSSAVTTTTEMNTTRLLVFAASVLSSMMLYGDDELTWSALPGLPDEHGFAGMYAGVSGGGLIAAGGANFPQAPPWQGGSKVWHAKVFVLPSPEGTWRIAETELPRGLAYGVSLTVRHPSIETSDHRGVVCLGGDDGRRASRDVFLLALTNGKVSIRALPQLPGHCTQMCGALVGDTIYIAGGAEALDATKSRKTFWSAEVTGLLTAKPGEGKAVWKERSPWPGDERMQAIAATDGNDFFLFGGVRLTRGDDGNPTRVTPYLRDAYRYRPQPKPRWEKLPDMPRPLAAAPSPAPQIAGEFALFGGVDGSLFTHDPATHPGFTRRTLRFDPAAQQGREGRPLPETISRVTVPLVRYRDGFALISGEVRPGIRSPSVWWAKQEALQPRQ
jgi:N-acetylneuraminate epimerase